MIHLKYLLTAQLVYLKNFILRSAKIIKIMSVIKTVYTLL